MDCARAHGAWLCAGIQGAGCQFLRREVLAGKPHQVGLGVAGTVMAGDYRIFRLQQSLIMFIHQQRAKRMIAVVAGLLRNGYGSFEMSKVYVVQANFLYL
jgi:hypothetical protein